MSSVTTLDILIVAQHCALKAILLAQHSPNQMRNQFAYAAAYAAYAAAIEAKMGGEDEMVLTHARSAVDYALSAGVAYEDLIVEASRIGWFGNVASPTAC
jgi:hypothetical protein